jgi:cleavage and polyadenylation specificity factor subunit 2
MNDYELSYVTGVIQIPEETKDAMSIDEEESAAASAETIVPTLDVLPLELQRTHKPVIVGDLKLSEFRRKLLDRGYEAEFDAGVLIVNRNFLIRRSQQGRLVLEGTFGREYFKLRSMMYSEHAII